MYRQSLIRLLGLALLLAFIAPWQAAAQVTQPRYCGKSAFLNITTAATTQIAPPVTQAPFASTPTIGGVAPLTGVFICGYVLVVSGTVPTATFSYGFPAALPGTGCGASPVAMSPTYPAGVYIDTASVSRGLETPGNNVLCVTTTGTSLQIGVQVYYDNNPL